jgi:hypothetical protein
VKDDKDEHRNEYNITELPLGHTPFTTLGPRAKSCLKRHLNCTGIIFLVNLRQYRAYVHSTLTCEFALGCLIVAARDHLSRHSTELLLREPDG